MDWREIKGTNVEKRVNVTERGGKGKERNEGITKNKSRTKKRKQLLQKHVWAVCACSPSLVSA